jgi:large subunit ribosomal protein L29
LYPAWKWNWAVKEQEYWNRAKDLLMRNSFKNLTFAELKAKRDELSRKYMDFRFQLIIGHVDNPLQKRQLRRQIARLNTMIWQQERAQQKEPIVPVKA